MEKYAGGDCHFVNKSKYMHCHLKCVLREDKVDVQSVSLKNILRRGIQINSLRGVEKYLKNVLLFFFLPKSWITYITIYFLN